MGRRPIYDSPKKLEKAVRKYFDGISFWEDSREINALGQHLRVRRWIEPPSMAGLCLALKIEKSTWARYSDSRQHPDLAPVCAWAKYVVEQYLYGKSLTENCRGAIFNLQANFGYSERQEVELGRQSRAVAAKNGMTMDEKLALIRAAAGEIDADTGD